MLYFCWGAFYRLSGKFSGEQVIAANKTAAEEYFSEKFLPRTSNFSPDVEVWHMDMPKNWREIPRI